ncbi:thioredoxin domain-containing protein [Erysipelotrichaceae bacterium RD49]|nr:thioredoxin domain-containing protein [Erysipelotrichaceae bacterium RD49]
MDAEDVNHMLYSDLYKREVNEDEMEFRALGIESVPYFIIDTEVIPEHLTKEKMMEVLKKHMEHPVLDR